MALFNIPKSLITLYQAGIDDLINQIGKNITLYFKPTITNVENQFKDIVRNDSLKKPNFATPVSDNPSIVYNTKVIKALLQHNPRDFETFGIKFQQGQDVLRVKCFLTDIPDLNNCEYMIPNSDVQNVVYNKYKMLRQAVPQGLQEDRYSISFWTNA